jgi:RimJ/RimL family protein N-acetyltransferase
LHILEINHTFSYDELRSNEMITYREPEGKDAEAELAFLRVVGGESDNLNFGKEGLPLSVEEEATLLSDHNPLAGYRLSAFLEDGSVVGDIHIRRGKRRTAHTADLGIAVCKAYWGKGVSSTLMRNLIIWCKDNGVTKINLQVREDNLHAKAFYAKCGFTKEGMVRRLFLIDGVYFDGEAWGLLL